MALQDDIRNMITLILDNHRFEKKSYFSNRNLTIESLKTYGNYFIEYYEMPFIKISSSSKGIFHIKIFNPIYLDYPKRAAKIANLFFNNLVEFPYSVEEDNIGFYILYPNGKKDYLPNSVDRIKAEDIAEWRPTETLPEDYYAF